MQALCAPQQQYEEALCLPSRSPEPRLLPCLQFLHGWQSIAAAHPALWASGSSGRPQQLAAVRQPVQLWWPGKPALLAAPPAGLPLRWPGCMAGLLLRAEALHLHALGLSAAIAWCKCSATQMDEASAQAAAWKVTHAAWLRNSSRPMV